MNVRVAVVDTTEVFRLGIRELVSTSDTVTVVGDFAHLDELLVFLETAAVDILIFGNTDLYRDWLPQIAQIYATHPNLKVILLARAFTTEQIEELSKLGTLGFICKDEPLTDSILFAIRPLLRDEPFISPKVAKGMIASANGSEHNLLSSRQMELIGHMANYLTPQEIAQKMKMTPGSVYSMQYRIREALALKTSSQIVLEAMKRGLIGEE